MWRWRWIQVTENPLVAITCIVMRGTKKPSVLAAMGGPRGGCGDQSDSGRANQELCHLCSSQQVVSRPGSLQGCKHPGNIVKASSDEQQSTRFLFSADHGGVFRLCCGPSLTQEDGWDPPNPQREWRGSGQRQSLCQVGDGRLQVTLLSSTIFDKRLKNIEFWGKKMLSYEG